MSRIGKKEILIPAGVEVKIDENKVFVKGPKGELSRVFRNEIKIEKEENKITLKPKTENPNLKKYWGLTRALLFNMIEGVSNGFKKELQIEGIGYRAEIENGDVILRVGFSHPIRFKKVEGLTFSVDKNIISVEGIEKEKVGLFAAKIRSIKKPEPYKGKGIRYVGEFIKRKAGKKVAGTA